MFSYGSGLAASMFSVRFSGDTSSNSALSILIKSVSDIPQRLQQRQSITASQFEGTLNLREKTHNLAPYTPTGEISQLNPGTYYLTAVSEKHHRVYAKA